MQGPWQPKGCYRADALDLIVSKTQGYPYFLQEWGKHTWDVAESSPITAADVEAASQLAVAGLDQSFFLSGSTG